MALGLTTDIGAVKKNMTKGRFTLYIKECDSAGTPLTTGDGTIWQCLGYTNDTSLSPQTENTKQKDDTNADVLNEDALSSYEITTTLLQRNAAARNLTENAQGKFYQMVAQGADIGTLTEFWGFALCKINLGYTYKFNTGQIEGVKVSTISNSSAITVTPPTTLTASTLTIAAGAMKASADLVHA